MIPAASSPSSSKARSTRSSLAGTRGYLAERAPRLRREAIERGVLLRPLGDVLYAMPPACTRPEQCDRIAQVMVELARLTDD